MIIVHERREPKGDEVSPCVKRTFKITYTGNGFKLENYNPAQKMGTIVELDDTEGAPLSNTSKNFSLFNQNNRRTQTK